MCVALAFLLFPLGQRGRLIAQEEGSPLELVQVTFFNSSLIDEVIPFYESIADKSVIVDQSIAQTTLSLNTSRELTKAEAIDFLKASLLLNGIAIVRHDDKTDKFLNTAVNTPPGEGAPIIAAPEDLPNEDVVVSYVMILDFITPDEAVRTMQLVARPHAYGSITPVPNASAVVITDKVPLIRTLIDLKQYIDKAAGEVKPEDFILERADATDVAASLQEILGQQASGSSGGAARTVVTNNAPVPGGAAGGGAAGGGGAVLGSESTQAQIIPDPRRNAIVAIARPVDLIFIESLIKIFDAPSEVDTFLRRELKYIPVANFIPVATSALERYVGDGQATGATGTAAGGATRNTTNRTNTTNNRTTGGVGGGTTGGGIGGGSLQAQDLGGPESQVIGNTLIIGDPQLNNVIVSGPPEQLRIVEQLIDELDVRPRQVYISAVIAQISLDDDIRFGFDLLRQVEEITLGGDPVNIAGLYRTNSQITIIDPLDLAAVSDFPLTSGLGLYAKIGDFFNAYIQALENTNQFQVLSRPFVFTDNNQQATIASGERVAVPTQTISSVTNNDTVNSSIGFEEVLLQLEVIPLINSKDEVTLTILQENENITGFTTISNNEVPNIATQQLNTTVRIPNRGIVVLGGIIQEQDRDNISGFPFASRIPGLRHLTGTTVQETDRSELLIFIQPIIIEDTDDLIDANIEETNRTVVGEAALDMARHEPVRSPILYDDNDPEASRGTEGDLIPTPDNSRVGQKIRNLFTNPNRKRLFGGSR